MEYKDLTKEDLIKENIRLNGIICELKSELASNPPKTREDKIKLAILDEAPYSCWACDRNFNIIVWAGNCEKMYNISAKEAIGKNYLDLFVDEYERTQSEMDCLRIIDKNYRQVNFLAGDKKQNGGTVTVLTNCFRVYDEETKDYLQAEVGLDMGFDVDTLLSNYRTWHALMMEQVERNKKLLEYEKRDLVDQIKQHFKKEEDEICDAEKCNLRWAEESKEIGGDFAKKSREEVISRSDALKGELKKRKNSLLDQVSSATKLEDLDSIKDEVRGL
ncbi:MAG: PAS domain-containing protein [Candidatus Bathyarchaeia archaeon]